MRCLGTCIGNRVSGPSLPSSFLLAVLPTHHQLITLEHSQSLPQQLRMHPQLLCQPWSLRHL